MRYALVFVALIALAAPAAGCGAQSERQGWEAFCQVALPQDVDPANRSAVIMRAIERAVTNPDVLEALRALGRVPPEQRPSLIRRRLDATGVEACPTLDALAP